MRPLPSPAVARNLERIAWLMDRAIKIPGTNITLGLDALLGLLPVGGDVLTGFVQVGLVLVALKLYRVPRAVAARMMGNVLLDITVGAIPLLGDLFDVVFKANTKNLKLLESYQRIRDTPEVIPAPKWEGGRSKRVTDRYTVDARPGGTPWRYLLPIAAVLVAALALVIIGLVTIVRWLL
jgi:hypothetical protein